jgi:hypothetical protein
MRNLLLPHLTAWDYYFHKRVQCFVLIHLKDGNFIGGLYASNSFATAFPRNGDIYIELVYRVNKADKSFGEAIEGSNGAIVRASDYTIIEFFCIPSHRETTAEKPDGSASTPATPTPAGAATAPPTITTTTTTTTTTTSGPASRQAHPHT